ncbi:MAG: outer membrane beta-barrel protein, partial [Candidatus Cryptobacteroides sp.]
MKKTVTIVSALLLGIYAAAQNQDLDSLLIRGIPVESLPDEIVDSYDLRKKKPINDYSMIGFQYGLGWSRTLLNPEFAKQDFVFMPYNVGVMYTRYGKMFGYMPYFGIQVGLFYAREGYKFRYNSDDNYVPVFLGAQSAVMDVVEVPVLAHCHVDFWKMKAILNVGFYGGYRLGIHRYAPEVKVERYHNLT